ncbi:MULTISPECIES: phosphatase PAP2 family protein [unclassified Pseudomonas]|uniref:phosphatase PAP2 family protein n=1 Tax=unclassified Pseudomonas TaxID=196821 RepID=UPI000C86C286|nr:MULTISPECIES: phosphatase PAP2 family protein [unclassified Pseudomonas]MBA4359252.1 PAP2 family protein [Pseudomonas sp.]PMV83009.1 PAP2 family protein [Pseudomonas sp. GW101-1A09]PMV86290.1 PAP2 family protein [Pseudomonas sp. FW306-2-2C-B10A]PMV92938.1 PAP2 family protein [Pseudomonas sp. GW460-C8]PMW01074.1 PAP2 family protein [Pseudomonas sp. MPR-TSA4]
MLTSSRNRFYWANFGIPLACAALVFLMFDMTRIDIAFSNLLFDPVAQIFPLDKVHFFEKLTHKWARIIPNWTAEIALIGAMLSFVWPLINTSKHPRLGGFLERSKAASVLRFANEHRRDFLFVVFAFAICTGVIHFLKAHTSVYCPIETTLYGGKLPHVEWYNNFQLFREAGDGRCWPGGHASGGFTMLALYFVARRYRWRYSKALMYGALLLGFVYGTTRVLQGWHYMSHTFWAGIFVWLACLLTALPFYGRALLEMPVLQKAEAPTVEPLTGSQSSKPDAPPSCS